jgi:hypothetical protein
MSIDDVKVSFTFNFVWEERNITNIVNHSVTQSLKNNGTFVGQTNSEPTLQHTSTMTSSLTNIPNSNPPDIFHAMFYGSTINGGTFNVNINFMSSSSPKRPRQS